MSLTNAVLFLQHCVLVSQIMTILSKRLQGLILDSDSNRKVHINLAITYYGFVH